MNNGKNADIQGLREFVFPQGVAEANSLTGGARRTSLSTAAASMRTKSLEGQLGSRLFYRDSQGVELIPAGLFLAKPINKLF